MLPNGTLALDTWPVTVRNADMRRFTGYSLEEIFGACMATLQSMGFELLEQQPPHRLVARAAAGILSWGENVEVTVDWSGLVVVHSQSRVRTTLLDWGKNKQNVSIILKQLASRLPTRAFQVAGDYINATGGSTVINRSYVVNALNSLATGTPEHQALERLAGLIEHSGSSEATEQFNALTEHIGSGRANRSVLRALLDGIIKALPGIGEVANLASEIMKAGH